MKRDDDTDLDLRGPTNTPTTQYALGVDPDEAPTKQVNMASLLKSIEPRVIDSTQYFAAVDDPTPLVPVVDPASRARLPARVEEAGTTTDPDLGDHDYEVIDKIGHGSMAEIYLVRDVRLSSAGHDHFLALKVLSEKNPWGEQAESRLKKEVRLGQIVRSEFVSAVHDLTRFRDGRWAIAMELIHGSTLTSIIQHGLAVDYLRHARWGRDIAKGLAAAHGVGVVHRDLKPDNIMIREANDAPVILDFGVAKFFNDDVSRTQQGSVIGTPLYMAPEQLLGKAEGRSDLFSLGLILARLATGAVPMTAQGRAGIYEVRVANPQRYRLLDHAPDAPPEYAAIIDRLLEYVPDARFPSAADLVNALQTFLENGGRPKRIRVDAPADARATVPMRPRPVPLSLPLPLAHRERSVGAIALFVAAVLMLAMVVVATVIGALGWPTLPDRPSTSAPAAVAGER